ncbi:MAG: hypothetical protein MJB14_14940, partial [Spirochaetes bacterium]|nr:hypothetical protein [Spirochaetota bacterium]
MEYEKYYLNSDWYYFIPNEEIKIDQLENEFFLPVQEDIFRANIHLELPQKTGLIWFKREFVLPPGFLNQPIDLYLNKISMADVTYLNGEEIGKEGKMAPHYFPAWNYARSYPLAKTQFYSGKTNILMVKVYINQEKPFN